VTSPSSSLTARRSRPRARCHPDNYPLAGKDAFRTATGVHAAAIIKAQKKGDQFLADRVYSGVPADFSADIKRSRSAT